MEKEVSNFIPGKTQKGFFDPSHYFQEKQYEKKRKEKNSCKCKKFSYTDTPKKKKKTHKVGQLQNFLVTNNNNELMIFQN